MAEHTSLASVSKPWHLKLSVSVFDAKGGSQDGTIERWKAGEESHTIFTFLDRTVTEYDHAGDHYYAEQGGSVPQVMYDVLDAVLHPGPDASQLTGTTPELRKHSFGKIPLDCIMLSRPVKSGSGRSPAEAPLTLFPTYCLQPQTDVLQVISSYGNPTVLLTGLGKFLDHEIATAVTISNESVTIANGKVVTLTTFVPAQDDFTPPPEIKATGSHKIGIPAGVISGHKTGGEIPTYPVAARSAHISGTVILHAIIGVDGRVQRLTVMSTPDIDLAISALAAVRTWTYKPYLLNGEPVDIDTTITVNFNLSPG